jgi:hypothetical protein
MDAEDQRKLDEYVRAQLSTRPVDNTTRAQIMRDLWRYADTLEVEAMLKRMGVRWSQ